MNWYTIALISGGVGLLAGIFLARRSHQSKPLLSGIGQLFHYIACAAVATVPVAILTGLVTSEGRSGLWVAIGSLGVAAVALLIHAIPEYKAQSRIGLSTSGEENVALSATDPDGAEIDRRQRTKRITDQIGFLAFSLLIMLVLLELAARLIYRNQAAQSIDTGAASIFQTDEIFEWSLVPNYSTVVTVDGEEVVVETNSKGLRDLEYSYEKPANTFRIVVLGDSTTQAAQVNLKDAFHTILEDRLNETLSQETGLHYEVISAGVSAYGVTRELTFYENEIYQYDPDLVLLAYSITNDVQDDSPSLAQREVFPGIYREQFYRLNDQGQLDLISDPVDASLSPGASQAQAAASSLPTRIDAWLYSYSRFYFYVRPFLSEQIPFVRRTLFRAGLVRTPSPVPPRYSDAHDFSAAWELEAALIARLKSGVEADGAAFAVVIMPDYLQIQPEIIEADYPLFYPAILEDMDLQRPDRALLAILNEQEIAYLYLYPIFAEARARTGEDCYSATTLHWNRAGHALAGESLFKWLEENGLVGSR